MLVPKYQIVRQSDNSPATSTLFDRPIDAENYIKEHGIYPNLVFVVQVFDFVDGS